MRISIVTTAVFVVLVAALGCHPSDDRLIKNFVRHRADFEQILAMIQEDPNAKRIASDFIIPEGVISQERWSAYRELFRRAGVEDGIGNWGPKGPVIFFVSGIGLVTGGSTKGYAFLPDAPNPGSTYKSLNSRPPELASNARAYRPIADDWYIYYDWDD